MGNVITLYMNRRDDEMPTIFELAQAFLSFAPMSHKKLQKLCFYAQALYLALNNEPLVDCDFQAWIHGPVCPELYGRYRHWGYREIPQAEMPENIRADEYILNFINTIYDGFGFMSADKLEQLTHSESPWIEARAGLEEWENSVNVIKRESMEQYYRIYLED
ncbi:Panacea domain-containing protein [Clostridium saudiense]|uniref:Panacea domain-containing protein n=1 Tax=Clostridium saudiense TaxID=1414720 RepID=UPI0018AC4DC5|nr:type II toxin-antitoxin system antitoxin SocA domain-containing protein [Clostridium saudiense]